MNATSLEKQKKGNLYVYKFATGSRTPEYQAPTTSVTKRIISFSVWGLRKSKSKPKPKNSDEKKDKDNDKEVDGHGIVNHGKVKSVTMEKVRERKSVSSVEGILLSLANSSNNINENNKVSKEGRKTVSITEQVEGKGKGFPFPLSPNLKGKGEGARKSVSHIENNVAYVGKFVEKPRKSTGAKSEIDMVSTISLLQVKVLVTDMPAFMQIQAFQCARNTFDSLEKFSAKHIAFNLKKEFDKVYGPAWHCIVGSSFGSFVTHATGCFLYFSMEKLCILLFRTKVQRSLE